MVSFPLKKGSFLEMYLKDTTFQMTSDEIHLEFILKICNMRIM